MFMYTPGQICPPLLTSAIYGHSCSWQRQVFWSRCFTCLSPVSLQLTNLYSPGHAESALLPIEWLELFSSESVCVSACPSLCALISMGTAGLLGPLIRGRPVCVNAGIVGSCVFRLVCVGLCGGLYRGSGDYSAAL